MTARRVLVGRRDTAGAQTEVLLRAAGFIPVVAPLIEIAAPTDRAALRAAVSELMAGGYDWVAFTSVPAVHALLAVAGELGDGAPADGGPARFLAGGTRVAAVGPGTAAALRDVGVEVALTPPAGGSARALAESWPAGTGRVLIPRSDIAPSALPDALRAKGYAVDAVTAYRTVERALAPERAAELGAGGFAAVLLTSGSAARSLARYPVAPSTVVVAIGESTAAAAWAAGLTVGSVAAEPTAAGLVEAVRLALADPTPGATAPYPRSETAPDRPSARPTSSGPPNDPPTTP